MANAHINTALNSFFGASKYAVVGASKDPSKFGNKVRSLQRRNSKAGKAACLLTTILLRVKNRS